MATPPDRPWTNDEKNYLLAEILKTAHLPYHVLYDVVHRTAGLPALEDVPLPPGRSLTSCRIVLDDMRRSLSQQPLPMPSTPTPYVGSQAQKRSSQSMEGSFPGFMRDIRPKPMSSAPTGFAHRTSAEPPPKRKRGRPTRAEARQRAATAAATAAATVPGAAMPNLPPAALISAPIARAVMPYPYPDPAPATAFRPALPLPSPIPAPVNPPLPAAPEEFKPYVPTTRLPVADMLTPSAPSGEAPGSNHSSSSSGKRRRARSTKAEHDVSPTRTAGHRQTYESPYARIGGSFEDTPARTAVLRHRDDPGSTAHMENPTAHPGGTTTHTGSTTMHAAGPGGTSAPPEPEPQSR